MEKRRLRDTENIAGEQKRLAGECSTYGGRLLEAALTHASCDVIHNVRRHIPTALMAYDARAPAPMPGLHMYFNVLVHTHTSTLPHTSHTFTHQDVDDLVHHRRQLVVEVAVKRCVTKVEHANRRAVGGWVIQAAPRGVSHGHIVTLPSVHCDVKMQVCVLTALTT